MNLKLLSSTPIASCQQQYWESITKARYKKFLYIFNHNLPSVSFFDYIVTDWSMPLGISPPPGWISSCYHDCLVVNENTEKALEEHGKTDLSSHFSTIIWLIILCFQMHFHRVVNITGKISATCEWGKCSQKSRLNNII